MAKEEKKAPKLRFNGYTNDWEQVKLEKIATFSKGKGYSKLDLKRKGYPIFLYGQMYTNYRYKIVETSTYAILKEDAVVSNGNEIVIPSSGETSVDIARASWIAQKGIIIGSDLNIIRPTSSVHPLFLALSLSNNQVKYNLAKVAQGNSIVHLYNNNLKKVNIYFPNIVEQNRIGNILNSISNCINLHERKCEELALIKKALLQKLFPKKDEFKPEVRYKNFSDAWEQRKLGEILKERKERSSIGELISVTINNGVVKADSLERKDNSSSDKSNYKVVCKGDIAYNSMRMWQGASGYSPYNGILSPAYTVLIPTEKVDSKFISYMFKKEKMLQQFQKYSQGLTPDTWNLKYPMLKDIPVLFPKIDEQVSIRKHLDNISSLIALHQRKLEKLKQLKKFLLQNMFI